MYSSSNPIMQHITRTVSERWNKDQGLKYILYGHLSGANIHYSWYSALWKALAIWASYLTLFHYYWSNGSIFFGWKPVWPVEEQVLFLARETNSTFAHKAKKQKSSVKEPFCPHCLALVVEPQIPFFLHLIYRQVCLPLYKKIMQINKKIYKLNYPWKKKYWRGLCIDFLSKLYDEFKQNKMNLKLNENETHIENC